MTSSVVYEGALRTTCVHHLSGSPIETDAPPDNNGRGERFSPTDMLATSLATCMLTVMGIKARSMGFDLDGMKVNVVKIMAAAPRRVSGINLTFSIPDHLVEIEDRSRKVLKETGNTCPVMQSIHPGIEVNVDWGEWS